MGFFCLSQFDLGTDDANPVKIEFLLLAKVVKSAIQKCRVVVALNRIELPGTRCRFLETVRQHIAHV